MPSPKEVVRESEAVIDEKLASGEWTPKQAQKYLASKSAELGIGVGGMKGAAMRGAVHLGGDPKAAGEYGQKAQDMMGPPTKAGQIVPDASAGIGSIASAGKAVMSALPQGDEDEIAQAQATQQAEATQAAQGREAVAQLQQTPAVSPAIPTVKPRRQAGPSRYVQEVGDVMEFKGDAREAESARLTNEEKERIRLIEADAEVKTATVKGQAQVLDATQQVQRERMMAERQVRTILANKQDEITKRMEEERQHVDLVTEAAKHPHITEAQYIKAKDMVENGTEKEQARGREMIKKGATDPAKIDTPVEWLALAMTTIGQAMGAYGAGLTGGPNHAMQLVKAMSDKRIARQRAEVERRKEGVQGAESQYSRLVDRLGSEFKAEKAMRISALEEYDSQLQQIKMGGVSKEHAAAIDELSIAAQKDITDTQAVFAAKQEEEFDAEMKDELAMVNLREQDRRSRINQAAAASRQKPKKALSAGEESKLADMQASIDTTKDLMKSFKEKTGKFSFLTKYVPGTESRQYERERAMAAAELVKSITGAGVSDKEREILMGLIPTSSTPAKDAETMFKTLMVKSESMLNRRIEALSQNYDVGAAKSRTAEATRKTEIAELGIEAAQ